MDEGALWQVGIKKIPRIICVNICILLVEEMWKYT